MNELGLSTINTKGTGLNKSDKLTKTVFYWRFSNIMMSCSLKFLRGWANQCREDQKVLQATLQLLEIDLLNLEIWFISLKKPRFQCLFAKKVDYQIKYDWQETFLAKRSGADLIREGTISRKDVFSFIQKKSQKKHYTTPLDFIAESKVSECLLKKIFKAFF